MAEPVFAKETGSVSRHEIKRYGYKLEFVMSADAVECHCSYEPATTGGSPLTNVELQGFLKQFKITEGLVPEAVSLLLNSAAAAKAVDRLLLALGTAMVTGEDGYIELTASDDLAATSSETDESGVVDLRRVQSFLNVETGDLVARVHLPWPGTSGMTVSGNVIPPQSGLPVKLQMGQNVHLGDDGVSIFASASGRVYCRDNEISVEDIYEVDGDVGFKVGNISFKGFVEVKGDVLDGFSIKATKGIKVQGIIGVCTIEAEGDVAFSGMNGQGKGTVRCGGSLVANFINETSIECAGDITVETEIRNSQIRCLGALRVNKSGLAGGEYFALSGIETAVLGNVSLLRTRVVVGVHYRDLEELNGLFNELKLLVAEYGNAPKGTFDPKDFSLKRAAITERTQTVRSRSYEQCNPKINVKKTLYEGVTVTLGTVTDNVREERKGPVTIIENTIEGGIRFLGMTTLAFKAQEIEKTFITQYQQNKTNNM